MRLRGIDVGVPAAACALVVCALLAAGCGNGSSDDASSGGSSAPRGIQAGTGSRADVATKAADAAAGKPVVMPKTTAGLVQIAGAGESSQRVENSFDDAAKALGWKVLSCDAQGDPIKMARCADSLLDRKVNVLFTISIDPSLIKAQLQKAKSVGVPVFSIAKVTPSPLFAGMYATDPVALGKVLADYVVRRMKEVPGKKEIALHTFPAPWATVRSNQLKAAIAGTDIKIATTATSDAANLDAGTRKTVTDQLTRDPNLKAFWFDFDTAGQAGGQAVRAKDSKPFPNGPLVVTFHADLGTVKLMRAGDIDAVADEPYDAQSYLAADQAAELLARQQQPSKDYAGPYPVKLFDYVIVDKSNLPAPGAYRQPGFDFVTFFQQKWKKEFTPAQ